jgi:hypothetical protein
MEQARERVFAACRKNRVPFLETCSPENIAAKLDEGVRVIAGHREETARVGRAHQKRTMPVYELRLRFVTARRRGVGYLSCGVRSLALTYWIPERLKNRYNFE